MPHCSLWSIQAHLISGKTEIMSHCSLWSIQAHLISGKMEIMSHCSLWSIPAHLLSGKTEIMFHCSMWSILAHLLSGKTEIMSICSLWSKPAHLLSSKTEIMSHCSLWPGLVRGNALPTVHSDHCWLAGNHPQLFTWARCGCLLPGAWLCSITQHPLAATYSIDDGGTPACPVSDFTVTNEYIRAH